MKTVTVEVPKDKLTQLISEADPGDLVILTDGTRHYTLESTEISADFTEDNSELENELLKAVNSPVTPYSSEEMRQTIENLIAKKKGS